MSLHASRANSIRAGPPTAGPRRTPGSLRYCHGALQSSKPSGPYSLNVSTQSRTTCNVIPPIFIPSVRDAPSQGVKPVKCGRPDSRIASVIRPPKFLAGPRPPTTNQLVENFLAALKLPATIHYGPTW
jgi:hypothetical protein